MKVSFVYLDPYKGRFYGLGSNGTVVVKNVDEQFLHGLTIPFITY